MPNDNNEQTIPNPRDYETILLEGKRTQYQNSSNLLSNAEMHEKHQQKKKLGRPKNPEGEFKRMLLLATPDILQVVIDFAKAGDMAAAKVILDRTLPVRKSTLPLVEFEYKNKGTPAQQIEYVIEQVSLGIIAADVGKVIIDSITLHAAVKQQDELTARIEKLEAQGVQVDRTGYGNISLTGRILQNVVDESADSDADHSGGTFADVDGALDGEVVDSTDS